MFNVEVSGNFPLSTLPKSDRNNLRNIQVKTKRKKKERNEKKQSKYKRNKKEKKKINEKIK